MVALCRMRNRDAKSFRKRESLRYAECARELVESRKIACNVSRKVSLIVDVNYDLYTYRGGCDRRKSTAKAKKQIPK